MIKEKYMKIVYQTPPIGEYGIVLYLTTFDIEALKRDELKEKKQNTIFINNIMIKNK